MTDPDKFKKTLIHFWQLAFFALVTYIFITPVYIFSGHISYDSIMYVFIGHILFLTFGTSIILEVLNNYRYILTWIYWTFVWIFITVFITILIFFSLTNWYAKLISLLVLLPLINTLIVFFKQVFEFLYFYYYKTTSLDQLGDIFYQIELEEKENLREAEENSSL